MTHIVRPQNETRESLSFQDITAEIGDLQIPLEENLGRLGKELPNGTDIPEEAVNNNEALRSNIWEDQLNKRVLTGSSPKPRPMWFDGLMSNLLAGTFIMPVILNPGLRGYQPWISYMAVLLALGASLWSLSGLRAETSATGKSMCFIGAAIGIIVIALALYIRAPLI